MSIMSTRRTEVSSRRSTRKTPGGSVSTTYDVYCVNFYDNGLNAVRDEFIRQIKLGLRRFLFVIDLDKELEEAYAANEMIHRLSSKVKKPDALPTDPVELTQLRIRNCLNEYEFVTRRIEAELSFNMLKYYQKYNPAQLKIRAKDSKNVKTDGSESKRGKNTAKSKETTDTVSRAKISCFGVNAKEHHKVGKGQPLSKRLYIKDEPSNTNILIVIIGNLDNDFYKELLDINQPVRGIIHFLPEECAYDLLVPRPRREKFLRDTIEKIQRDIHSLRKRSATKPVGIMQQQLPQMSMCQAVKYTNDIYDQLSWFLYDMQTLREHYDEYYVKPYHQINVQMNPAASMQANFQIADSLSIQGHYLNAEMPAVHEDDATIYLYVESLMSTFGSPRELMTEIEVLLLANPSSHIQTKVLDKIKVYANAFKSIIKLPKSERLFVEHSNTLLTSMVTYMDQKLMRNIYHACLEYNILRRYFTSGYITESLYYTPYIGEVEPRHLPKYAKLYLTEDAVRQRIVQLINEYDNYEIEEIYPNVKLYTFKRGLNEVFEHQKQIVIPTRLCFRDFTLYEMQQFLKDLVTPQMFEASIEERPDPLTEYPSVYTMAGSEDDISTTHNCRNNKGYIITPSIFNRPKSLKAKKVLEQQREQDKKEKLSPRLSRMRSKESFRATAKSSRLTARHGASVSQNVAVEHVMGSGTDKPSYIGLGPGHAMLTGYNLDDVRQTIKVKTSKYHFEEGHMTLYEEKWNFRQMNKCLSFEIDNQLLHFTTEPGKMNQVSHNIRLQTPHGLSLRVEPKSDECAKAVLNYPNGLSLYCHDKHAEHQWSGRQSELNESRRISTPFGCVIIFYNDNDTVLIMRYNGEVYRLYSYVYPAEEMEGEMEGEMEDETDEFINACSTQSTYSSYKPLQSRDSTKSKKSRVARTHRNPAGADRKPTLLKSNSSTSSQTLAARAAKTQARQMQLAQTAALFASIDAELKFLEHILQLFEISYKHLMLTTSLGSVVHVEKAKIYCGKPIRVTEWHDYYANESYAMRDDGVRMVWTQDSLRCYHSDGTMISTTTVDGWDKGVIEDEIDKQISSSSSHLAQERRRKSGSLDSSVIYINVPPGLDLTDEIIAKPPVQLETLEDEYLQEMEVEDQYIYDYSFETYAPDSYLMQHKFYAATQFNFTHINEEGDLKVDTTVVAADNLEFCIYTLPLDESQPEEQPRHDSQYSGTQEYEEKLIHFERLSSEADPDEWTRRADVKSATPPNIDVAPTVVDIKASNLQVSVQVESIQLKAHLRKFGCDENVLVARDMIELKMDLKQSLSTAFHNWVEEFHKFIDCFCPKWRTTHFIEAITEDCRKKGFELFKTVPSLGKFNFCQGNYFIDPEELKSLNAHMLSTLSWYEKDMRNFPRFPAAKKATSIVNFPTVLSTRIFVEIPAQLAYTDRIHLFIYPFEKVKFRKLKHRFSEAVLFHLHPLLRSLVHRQISERSWRNHHTENKRRKFLEQQRLSLYVAMLRHKVYPNYFQFKDQYFNHVRNIDFFEFMASKCNEKANPDNYNEPNPGLAESPDNIPPTKEQKARRKKCLCPKYEKSLL